MKLQVQSKLVSKPGATTKDLVVRRENKIEKYAQGDKGWNHITTLEFPTNAAAKREMNSMR